jgi:hypothetical protein
MATEAEQVEKQVEKNENVINIPLKVKQKEIIKKIATDKQKLQEEFNKLQDKEGSVISVLLEAKDIDDSQVDNIQLSQDGNSMVITMKKKEELKKEEAPRRKPEVDAIEAPIEAPIEAIETITGAEMAPTSSEVAG